MFRVPPLPLGLLHYWVGTLQNLCSDPVWSERALDYGMQGRLEELLSDEDPAVTRYAAGALQNQVPVTLMVTLPLLPSRRAPPGL